MDAEETAAPADTQSIEDFISVENARERSGESPAPPPATPEPLPPPEVSDGPGDDTVEEGLTAKADRNTDGTFKPKKPRHDPQSRIDQAISRQKDAERRAAELEARLAERDRIAAQPPTQQRAPEPTIDPRDPEPNPDDLTKYADGQFDRKYLKDQARWEARQELKEAGRYAREQHEAQSFHQELHQKATTFHERIAPAMADPTFYEQIHPRLRDAKPLSALTPQERGSATFANFLAEQVFESEHPKELLLYLSDEPTVQRLATLPPVHVIRELARFEARLPAAPAAPVVSANLSHAKRPIQPLGSSPQAGDPYETTEDMATDEWIRRENAKERRALSGR